MTFGRWNTSGALTWVDGGAPGSAGRGYSDDFNKAVQVGVPVGGKVAWLKSLTGTPASLPAGWAECDGSTISDSDSPMNGQALPNLNSTHRMLRGSTTSGTTGGAATHNFAHTHTATESDINRAGNADGDTYHTFVTDSQLGTVTSPKYYDVVWIMRYK